MPDGYFKNVFATDRIRQGVERFGAVSNGFNKKQRDWAAVLYFNGVADGAKLAIEPGLEKIIRDWIVTKLRPLGFDAAAAELGLGRGNAVVGLNGQSGRSNGAGSGATGG